MSVNFTSFRLVTLIAILALPAMVRAQTLADRLPADTAIYAGWQGVDSATPGFAGSNLQGFLADSHIPAVIHDFLPKVLDRIAKEDKDSAEAVEVIRGVVEPMLRHPTAIALVGFDIDQKTGPRPKMIFLCDAGNELAALKAKVSDLLLKQPGPPPFPVNLIEKGNLLALMIGFDHPDAAIPDVGGESLATNPAFIKTLAQVDKDAFFTAYIDVEKMLAIADKGTVLGGPEVQKNWEKARELLGLKGVQRAIVTEGFDGKDWGVQAFIAAPAPRTGLIGSMLNGKPLSPDFLAAIPENATVAGATHFDLAGFVAAIRSGVASFDADTAKQIDDGFSQVNQTVGMDIQKDLLANLGDEWAYYVDPSVAGNGVVGATVVNHLKDPAKTEAALVKLEEFINKFAESQLKDEKITVGFQKETIDDVLVHYLAVPLVTPSWAVADGNLYVGLYPEVVAAAVNVKAKKSKSLDSNPAFIAIAKRLGEHPVSSFQFVDVPKRAPENYSSWLVVAHLANAGDLFGVRAPVAILPPLGKLMKHLSASGQIAWADADGFHARGVSAFPGSDVFASDQGVITIYQESAIVGLMLMPVMSYRQSEAAFEPKSSANLKKIAVAAITYSNTHNGKYPKDLGELYANSEISIDAFVNPATNNVAPQGLPRDQAAKWVREHSDYVWNGAGKDSTIGADEALAWENPATAEEGVYILYGDYRVEFKPIAEAKQIIEKAKKPAVGL